MNSWPIEFGAKDLVAVALLLFATFGSTIVLVVAPGLRAAALATMAVGAVLTEKLDVNIYSAYWYRGTTRGFEVTAVDVLAVAVLLASLLRPAPGARRGFWPPGLGPMLLFSAACGLSVVLSTPQVFGWYELSKLARGIVIFLAAAFAVRSRTELAAVVIGLTLAVTLEGATAIRQRLFEGIYRVTGTLDHPNSLSMYLCLAAPVLVAAAASDLPRIIRWAAGGSALIAAVTAVLTLSRAGLPSFAIAAGGALVACVSWRVTPIRLFAAAAVALGLAVVVGRSWDLLAARYGQASLGEEYFDGSGETRGYYFRQAGAILSERPMGVGLNNWSFWVSRKYGEVVGMRYEDYGDVTSPPDSELLPMYRYAAPAHNLGVLTAGEVGWWGLGLFAIVWLRWLRIGAGFLRPRVPDAFQRLGVGIFFGVLGVFMQSATEWTFRQTQIFLTFHLLAGVLGTLRHKCALPTS